MSYEDLVTIKAFLMALESLDQPLPESVQTDLGVIVQALPESAYELHDLAERYEPLNQEYLAVLQDFPGEGECLKFVPSESELGNGSESDSELTETEVLIQKLQHQIAQASINLKEAQSVDNTDENTVAEHCYIGIGRSQDTSYLHSMKQTTPVKHLIQELGWTREQAAAIRYRLATFREDWEAPGMEIYDDL